MDRMRCLEILIEIAHDGSFTAAAKRLAIAKSSVTKYVSALEHLRGARLIDRGTPYGTLTEAGRAAVFRHAPTCAGGGGLHPAAAGYLRAVSNP